MTTKTTDNTRLKFCIKRPSSFANNSSLLALDEIVASTLIRGQFGIEFIFAVLVNWTMKIAIALLAIVGLVAGSSISKHEVKIADKDFLAKQKFLFEIVYRVEDPLMFEEWIKMGKTFTFDKNNYSVSTLPHIV